MQEIVVPDAKEVQNQPEMDQTNWMIQNQAPADSGTNDKAVTE